MKKLKNSPTISLKTTKKLLAVLIDPDKFSCGFTQEFLKEIPKETTHIFVGGSSVPKGKTDETIKSLKKNTALPIVLFPGDYSQISSAADAVLFLNLISGRNPEYLIEQQLKSIPKIQNSGLEIISTGYILVDGGNRSSVERVTQTKPISQEDVTKIVHTALAGQYMGAKIIYLEAGSGAKYPVHSEIIRKVKKALKIPLIVGGGIRSESQKADAYRAGADMVVMGTVFEEEHFYEINKSTIQKE